MSFNEPLCRIQSTSDLKREVASNANKLGTVHSAMKSYLFVVGSKRVRHIKSERGLGPRSVEYSRSKYFHKEINHNNFMNGSPI